MATANDNLFELLGTLLAMLYKLPPTHHPTPQKTPQNAHLCNLTCPLV